MPQLLTGYGPSLELMKSQDQGLFEAAVMQRRHSCRSLHSSTELSELNVRELSRCWRGFLSACSPSRAQPPQPPQRLPAASSPHQRKGRALLLDKSAIGACNPAASRSNVILLPMRRFTFVWQGPDNIFRDCSLCAPGISAALQEEWYKLCRQLQDTGFGRKRCAT